jgi:hypothetical protein
MLLLDSARTAGWELGIGTSKPNRDSFARQPRAGMTEMERAVRDDKCRIGARLRGVQPAICGERFAA